MIPEPPPPTQVKTLHRVTTTRSIFHGRTFENMERLPPNNEGLIYLREPNGLIFHESELEEITGQPQAAQPPPPRYRLHVTTDFADHYAVIKDELDSGRVVATVHTIEDSKTVLDALNQHAATHLKYQTSMQTP